MADAHAQRAAGSMGGSRRLDVVLTVVVVLLTVAVLGVAGYFGWSVYQDRLLAEEANPALRVAKSLREAVREAPNDAAMRVRYGEALAAAGNFQEAIAQFNAALKIEPEHGGAFLDLGTVAMINERYSEAEKYFNQVLDVTEESEFADVDQRRELALYNLGRLALNEKEYEKAAGYFKQALRIRKDASDTYYHLALALQGMDEPDEAVRQLEFAISFDPGFAQAHYQLGQIYMAQDDKVNAAYHYYFAAKAEPDADPPQEALAALGTPDEWTETAEDALKADDLDAAVEAALIARNLDQENVDRVLLHARVLKAKGDNKAALAVYKEAQELDPENEAITKQVKKLQGK